VLQSECETLVRSPTSDAKPRFVEIIARALRSGQPNHHRCRIGHRLEPSLALAQPFFSALSFSDFFFSRS
jgi:hypothetical protein